MVNENETPEPVEEEKTGEEVEGVKVSEVVEEEPVEEVTEEVTEEVAEALMSLNDVKDRFVGIVDNARAAGIASVTNRGFAALEGFFGALAGDKEKRPPKREYVMGWLLGPLLGGVLGGIVVVRLLEFFLGGVSSGVMNVITPIFFVGTVSAVTTQSGMSKFTSLARKFQRGSASIEDRLDSITHTKRERK